MHNLALSYPPGGNYNKNTMPRGKKKATLESLEDITGLSHTRRWNYCQLIARELYRSSISENDLREIVQRPIDLIIGHFNY